MINSSDILRCINDKLAELPKTELERIIDEELEKPEDIMDADLIEYCLDALNELSTEERRVVGKEKVGDTNGKRIMRRFKRVIAVAVAAVLLFAGTVSVSAVVFDLNPFESIVEFYDNYIRIRFDNNDDKADEYRLLGSELAKELADNGISPVLLPEVITSEKCELFLIKYNVTNSITTADISFSIDNQSCFLNIKMYSDSNSVPALDFPNASNQVEQIKVSNLIAYVFEQGKNSTIVYQDGLIQYSMGLPLGINDAIELAKTLK